jgi:hypothetical protein
MRIALAPIVFVVGVSLGLAVVCRDSRFDESIAMQAIG